MCYWFKRQRAGCNNCGGIGLISTKCPTDQSYDRCFTCGETGHRSYQCGVQKAHISQDEFECDEGDGYAYDPHSDYYDSYTAIEEQGGDTKFTYFPEQYADAEETFVVTILGPNEEVNVVKSFNPHNSIWMVGNKLRAMKKQL